MARDDDAVCRFRIQALGSQRAHERNRRNRVIPEKRGGRRKGVDQTLGDRSEGLDLDTQIPTVIFIRSHSRFGWLFSKFLLVQLPGSAPWLESLTKGRPL